MKGSVRICVLLAILLSAGRAAWCADSAFSLGYGFAAWNMGRPTFKVEGDRRYDFVQATYMYERPFLWQGLKLLVEPFASYVPDPATGTDLGVGLGFKYYPFGRHEDGFYLMGGTGLAYSTIKFEEQGTHLFIIGQGGIGYRFGRFFIENRFRHFSNGHTAAPNWSVNANVITVGAYF